MDKEFECVLHVDHDLRLVRVVVTGGIDRAAGRKMITDAREASFEHGYDIFYDMRSARVKISITDLQAVARDLDVLKHAMASKTKVALVATPEEKKQFYQFYEITAYNAGLNVKSFVDEAEALAWLSEATQET